MPISDISKISWNKLKPRERTVRYLALRTLDLMREGKSLTKSAKEFGLDKETVKSHIKSSIYKRHGKWKAKKLDKIQREMNIYENGRIKSVIVRNSKDASLIGKYYNDTKKVLKTKDKKILKKYKRRTIRDTKGKKHKLETRLEKIFDIEESKEEPEFYQIYEV